MSISCLLLKCWQKINVHFRLNLIESRKCDCALRLRIEGWYESVYDNSTVRFGMNMLSLIISCREERKPSPWRDHQLGNIIGFGILATEIRAAGHSSSKRHIMMMRTCSWHQYTVVFVIHTLFLIIISRQCFVQRRTLTQTQPMAWSPAW
jgi:hypothetical protein